MAMPVLEGLPKATRRIRLQWRRKTKATGMDSLPLDPTHEVVKAGVLIHGSARHRWVPASADTNRGTESPASKLAGVVILAVIWATTTTAAATGEEAKRTTMVMAAGREAPKVMETGEALRRGEKRVRMAGGMMITATAKEDRGTAGTATGESRVRMEGGTMTRAMAAGTRAAAMVKIGMEVIRQRIGMVVMVMGVQDGIMVGTPIVGAGIRPTTGMEAMGISKLRQTAGGEHVCNRCFLYFAGWRFGEL